MTTTMLATLQRTSRLLTLALMGVLAVATMARYEAVSVARADGQNVMVGDGGSLGAILVDGQGFTLYTFDPDEPNKSNCNGSCATTWPPLMATGDSVAAPDDIRDNFSIFTRDDGSMQIAYKGRPLYRFAPDTEPGQTKGQGVGGVWFVVQP